MTKELDVRPLIVNNLKSERKYNRQIKRLLNDDHILIRKFNSGYIWNRKKSSYFIESLILGCEVHPLILFESEGNYFICDGINRYLAIKKFVNNELVLSGTGLAKLKWLAGKRFKDLKESEQNYFLHNIFMTYIVYKYENKYDPFKKISEEEEVAIQKQLYVRYNSGIRLAIEELQKAQFEGEYLTERFRKELESDENYRNKLKELYIGNPNKVRNEIDCMLVDIRFLIASTYSNIRSYCLCSDKTHRMNIFYEDQLCSKSDEEKEEMFNHFNVCVTLLSTIFTLPEWQKYNCLHRKEFIHRLYWAISVIRREENYPISKIDLKTIIEYFGKEENQYQILLNQNQAEKKSKLERYFEMAKYFKKYYAQDLTKEFELKTAGKKSKDEYHKIDVQQIHYRRLPIEITVADMLDQLENFRYNLRPSYQRLEALNYEASARIIESMLVDIQIPPILIFQKKFQGEVVSEVVDGQQRLLSVISYVNRHYKDDHGNLCSSEKEGYALTGLDIHYELNGTTYELTKNHKLLNKEKCKKIMNTPLYVVNIIENDEKEARDHFVRLNSNINPLKHNFFYWNAIADQKLLNKIEQVSQNGHESILGNNNVMLENEQRITALSYLFYNLKQQKNYTYKVSLSLSKITHWLKNFNKIKYQCFNKDEEKIAIYRQPYLNAIEETNQFLIKMELWLEYIGKDIRDLFLIKGYSKISMKNLFCLAQLLEHISLDDMRIHSTEIEKILIDFYETLHQTVGDIKKQENALILAREKIDIYDSNVVAPVHKEIVSMV